MAPKKKDYSEVEALIEAGYRTKEIHRKTGVSENTIRTIRKNLGSYVRPRSYGEDVRSKAKAFLDDGCSYAEVARTLKVDKTTVADWFPGRAYTMEQQVDIRRMGRFELGLPMELRSPNKK